MRNLLDQMAKDKISLAKQIPINESANEELKHEAFTAEEVEQIASNAGIDISGLNLEDLALGAGKEAQEHNDDNLTPEQIVGIAHDHLKEDPTYYASYKETTEEVEEAKAGDLKSALSKKFDMNFKSAFVSPTFKFENDGREFDAIVVAYNSGDEKKTYTEGEVVSSSVFDRMKDYMSKEDLLALKAGKTKWTDLSKNTVSTKKGTMIVVMDQNGEVRNETVLEGLNDGQPERLKVIGRSMINKQMADDLARRTPKAKVVSDEDDNKKFMVVVKESNMLSHRKISEKKRQPTKKDEYTVVVKPLPVSASSDKPTGSNAYCKSCDKMTTTKVGSDKCDTCGTVVESVVDLQLAESITFKHLFEKEEAEDNGSSKKAASLLRRIHKAQYAVQLEDAMDKIEKSGVKGEIDADQLAFLKNAYDRKKSMDLKSGEPPKKSNPFNKDEPSEEGSKTDDKEDPVSEDPKEEPVSGTEEEEIDAMAEKFGLKESGEEYQLTSKESEEGDYAIYTFSGFRLSLGNNYTHQHFIEALKSEQPKIADEIRSFGLNDEVVFQYKGSYGDHEDVWAVSDLVDFLRENVEEADNEMSPEATELNTKIQKAGELSGFKPEVIGGGIMGWFIPVGEDKELIFGFANGPLGYDLVKVPNEGDQPIESGEMDKEDATAEEMAEFVKQSVAKYSEKKESVEEGEEEEIDDLVGKFIDDLPSGEEVKTQAASLEKALADIKSKRPDLVDMINKIENDLFILVNELLLGMSGDTDADKVDREAKIKVSTDKIKAALPTEEKYEMKERFILETPESDDALAKIKTIQDEIESIRKGVMDGSINPVHAMKTLTQLGHELSTIPHFDLKSGGMDESAQSIEDLTSKHLVESSPKHSNVEAFKVWLEDKKSLDVDDFHKMPDSVQKKLMAEFESDPKSGYQKKN